MWKLVKYELSYAWCIISRTRYIYVLVPMLMIILLACQINEDSNIAVYILTLLPIVRTSLPFIVLLLLCILSVHLPINELTQKRVRLQASLPVPAERISIVRMIFQLAIPLIGILIFTLLFVYSIAPGAYYAEEYYLDHPRDNINYLWEIYLDEAYTTSMLLLIFTFTIRLLFESRIRIVAILFIAAVTIYFISPEFISEDSREQFGTILSSITFTWRAIPISLFFALILSQLYLRRESYLR